MKKKIKFFLIYFFVNYYANFIEIISIFVKNML